MLISRRLHEKKRDGINKMLSEPAFRTGSCDRYFAIDHGLNITTFKISFFLTYSSQDVAS